MMSEIAMSVLDVAENSVRANATWVRIEVLVDESADSLIVSIEDNGCGMSEEQVKKVSDPFFTTRTTRKVGLGVPFFKEACECTGGDFTIESKEGVGTKFTARFVLSHIDRIPLGDINGSIHQLVTFREEIHWIYRYKFNDKEFTMDTAEFREVLGDISFKTRDVSDYIMEYLNENKFSVDGGRDI